MKNNTYQNAVDHLEFSDDLYERVVQNANVTSKPVRFARAVAIGAVITVLLATTAFAVSSFIKDKQDKNETPITVQTLGTAQNTFDDAKVMQFTLSEDMQGVKVHYMELDMLDGGNSYFFDDGLLLDAHGNYYRITQDYQLELLQMQTPEGSLVKGEWTYVFPFDFTYAVTENLVVSNYFHGAPKINENGEVLVHVYRQEEKPTLYGGDIAWPVYLNVQTGQIRDALPQFSPEDFPDPNPYARQWKDGLLFDAGIVDGYRNLYWIVEGATDPILITIPEEGDWITAKDTIYYQDERRNLYRLDEHFELQLASPYNTHAMPASGLLEVMTDECKLGIYDLETGETYVFPEIEINRGSFTGTNAYYTLSSPSGRIALIKGGTAFESYRPVLEQIGILNMENQQLSLLQIENGYYMVRCGWLDADRLGVIYENAEHQYLCIYEFE